GTGKYENQPTLTALAVFLVTVVVAREPCAQVLRGHNPGSGFEGNFGVYTYEGFGGDDVGWASTEHHGVVRFGFDFDSPSGYLHMGRGGVWYVNKFTGRHPRVVTIETVRLRRRGTWDAYRRLSI